LQNTYYGQENNWVHMLHIHPYCCSQCNLSFVPVGHNSSHHDKRWSRKCHLQSKPPHWPHSFDMCCLLFQFQYLLLSGCNHLHICGSHRIRHILYTLLLFLIRHSICRLCMTWTRTYPALRQGTHYHLKCTGCTLCLDRVDAPLHIGHNLR
jgi:hypothetical protein